MGTTMTAVVISGDTAFVAHVGDSRCYLIRGGTITQLSRDHTLVARMVSEGRLTPEQAEAHPQRSVLTRALGADRDVEVDESRITVMDGDRLLLCSDGLTGMLSDDEIRDFVTGGSDLDEICRRLVDAANERGGVDNVTVVLIDVTGAPGVVVRKPHRARGRTGGRRFPVRLFIWLLLLIALGIGGYGGVRAWTNRSFYVGLDGNRVAIYRGLPVSFAGIHLSHVEQPTPILRSDIQAYYVPRLQDGVRVPSLAQARALLEVIPLTPEGKQRVHPTPSASPTASVKPSVKASAT